MKSLLSKKGLLSLTLITAATIIVLTEPSIYFINGGLFNQYESLLLEPLFYWSIAIALTVAVLILFSDAIFKAWKKWMFSIVLPIGLFLTYFGAGSGVMPNETDLAIFFGEIFVGLTLVFILVQKLFYKR